MVFDFDETIGYFSQLGLIIDSLENHIKRKITQEETFHLLDIFPNFFRPGIFELFKLIKKEKKKNKWLKMVIFTNNVGPKQWVPLILKYIEKKLDCENFFDKVIGAWKVKGEDNPREECRSSYDKSYDDLMKCYSMLEKYKICFLDDVIHQKMQHKNVDYLHLKAYRHEISYDTIVDTLLNSSKFKEFIKKRSDFLQYLKEYLNKEFFEYKHVTKLTEKKYSKTRLYRIINNFIKDKKTKIKKTKRKKTKWKKTKGKKTKRKKTRKTKKS